MWGAETEDIVWTGTSLTGTGGTKVTAGTASAVDGSQYKAGKLTISSGKIQTESKKHTNDSYWEDFSDCKTEGCTNIGTTARIEFPITISAGYSFSVTSIGFKMEQGGGSGPAVHAYITQADNTIWLGYTTANTVSYTPKAPATSIIQLSEGTAKLVIVLGVVSNLSNGRQFKLSNISIKGTSAPVPTTANLTWNFDGGSCSGTAGTDYTAAGAVAIGGEIKYPDNATMSKDGYNFNGWDSDATEMPDENLTITAQWVSASATEFAINYAETKGADMSAYPATYYEGVGIESFDPLTDVVDYHFVGWNPASISTEATGNQTITAQWVSAYNIEFNAGTGTGEVPATFQKWEGATFELPAQGALVADGKEFAGWSDGTNTYAAGDTYTMGAAAVTFTAQWKAAPTVLFHWRSNTGSYAEDAKNGTTIGGTTTLRTNDSGKSWGKESATYDSAVADDMKGETSGSELKSGGNALYLELTLTSGTFQEGDIIYVTGYKPWGFSTSNTFSSFDVVASIATGSSKEDVKTGSGVILEGVNASTIYVRRVEGAGSGIAAIKVIRPAQKEILSEDITLSAVTVNTEPISDENLATLKTDPYYKLDLAAEYAEAPTVSFTKQTLITYVDATTKIKTETIEVVATEEVDGKWKAQTEINDVTYTVTATALATYTVKFMDGENVLGTKLFDVTTNPSDADIDKTKALNTFAAWQKEGVDIALDAAFWATVAKDAEIILTARWTKVFATSYDMEAYAASAGADKDGLESELTAAGYAFTNVNGIDNGHTHNYIYDGMKYKTNDGDLSFNVNAGKLVIVKTGNLPANALTMYINGVADPTVFVGANEAVETHVNNYFYSEVEALYRLDIQASKGTCAIKAVTITDPFTVSFNANGGDDVASLNGTPFVTLPLPTKGTESFKGWYDAETGGNLIGVAGASYTPTGNIELHAQWEAQSTINTLSDLKVNGETVLGFAANEHTYRMVLPYKSALPMITSATPTNTNATVALWPEDGPEWTDEYDGGCYRQQVVVTPQDPAAEKGYYDIRITYAPKDGVSIIKVATTGGTNKTVTGLYAGEGDVNLSDSKKMDGGKYIGFTLDGTTLQAGDRINVHTTSASTSGGSHIIFYDNMTDKTELYDTEEIGGVGNNIFTINAAMVGNATAYVYRSDADAVHKWNGYIDYIEVTRPMNPVLTAITINGEAGTINESAKTVAVELQPGYDLAALTIVPTIVSNTAEADVVKTVTSNSGNWVIGDNTYRLTDKDGDYTEYTVTLTAGELKHNVSFNTHGGSTIDPVQVVDGQKLAAAPADPTKEDYIFKHWSLTDGGEEVDITTVQITENKEFHAVWAPDGAIKLLDGATVNHTNFITGVTAEKVTISEVEYDCVKFSGTVSGVNGVKDLTRVIAYNATTNQTKIKLSLYNTSTSSRTVQVKGLVEGADAAVDLAAIELGNKEQKASDWIEFNNAANRTIYIFIPSSAGDVRFLQVKVIESGSTTLPNAGEIGYSLNLNKGRIFGLSTKAIAFEGLNATFSGDYQPLNSSYAKLKSTSMSFTTTVPLVLQLTTNNNKTYYVANTAEGTDNETAVTGVSEFDLTAGTWYITAGSSEVQFTNIAFTAPKCEQPTVVDMENIGLCEGDAFTALTVSASVTDGGTLHYQWYKHPAEGDDEAVGTDAATYTPTADGQYYVIVTNKLADHSDNSKASNMVTVEHFASAEITTAPANQRKEAGQNATLTVAATGKAPLTYQWYTCDENGDNAELIDGAEAATYQVEVTAAMHQYYKVVVGSGCGSAEAIALVEEWHEVAPANVTGSRTWDWAAESMGTIETVSGSTEYLMANVSSQVPNTEAFRSDMLYITAKYANRGASDKFFQGWQIRFYTEVPGRVSLNCRAIHGTMSITINGTVIDDAKGSDMGTATTPFFVPAGWVTIVFDNQSSGYEGEAARVQKIVFNATPDYTRSGLTVGSLGTICLPSNVPAGHAFGATFYELEGKETQYGKIVFDEILSGELAEGVPYLFQAQSDVLYCFYGTESVTEPDNSGAMKGTFEDMTLTDLTNIYYFAQKALWSCVDLTSLSVPANRAYVKMDEMPDITESNPAPGVRRITLGVNGQQVATGVDQVQGDEVPTKMIINGQLFILRGEKMYDAQGKLVK